MNMEGKRTPASAPAINDRIVRIRQNILNRTLLILLLASVIGVFLSFSLTIRNGFHLTHTVQFSFLSVLVVTVVLKNKISYIAKYFVLMGILLLLAVFGIYQYGLFGNGVMFLIAASVLTSAFASPRYSVVVLVISGIIQIIFMYLFVSGRTILDFNQDTYQSGYPAWIGILVLFLMFTGMLISVISGLVRRLEELLVESDNQIHHIETLNTTLEEKVTLRTEELEQSNKDKDRILGVVAHDINNKLGGIIGYLDMLKDRDLNLDPAERQEFTETALTASLMARDIVNDLLEFSRQTGNMNSLLTERTDIVSFLRSAIDCHTPKALEKKINLQEKFTSETICCCVNRARFSRVLDNLITNALKFTGSGGNIIFGIDKPDDGGVRITIQDSGIGIPASIRDTIFTPFSNAGRPGTANEKSTGLGLSICKEIVGWHKGKIWFESEEGRGTTFHVWLPNT